MVPARTRNGDSLKEAASLFEQWRKQRKRRDPIPRELWDVAVACTERHSLSAISTSLRLNYADLKARTGERMAPAFIDVTGHMPTACTITMEKPTGERMTIAGPCTVIELVRAFFR